MGRADGGGRVFIMTAQQRRNALLIGNNNGDVLASHHLFPIVVERDVFRGGPRPDAVLGTPRRPKPGGGFGVDVSADDDDERRGDGDGDGWWWWEFRDQQCRGGDQGIIIIIIVHVAIQRTRDQPSARVEQERFGFTDHGAVAEETVQVGLSSFFRLLLSSSRREHHRALLSRCVYRYISVCGYDDAMTR